MLGPDNIGPAGQKIGWQARGNIRHQCLLPQRPGRRQVGGNGRANEQGDQVFVLLDPALGISPQGCTFLHLRFSLPDCQQVASPCWYSARISASVCCWVASVCSDTASVSWSPSQVI